MFAMAKKPTSQVPPKSFELAIEELEQILSDMEGDSVGLEESLGKYERGTYLLQWCRDVLGEAEKKIEVLSKGPAGEIVSTPLDEADDPEA
jgi:exodeoxyribonuclease VII small subunit